MEREESKKEKRIEEERGGLREPKESRRWLNGGGPSRGAD